MALRSGAFCYFHAAANLRIRALHPPPDGTHNTINALPDCDAIRREPILAEYFANTRSPIELDFPPIEDGESLLLSLSMILTALGQNRIDPKRAATLLYNLQIASSALRHIAPNHKSVVTDTVLDDFGTLIAPDQDPGNLLELQTFLETYETQCAAERQTRIDNGEDPEDIDAEDEEDYGPLK
jgi:hypothetical protein